MSSTSGIDHLTSKLADAKAAVAAGPQDPMAPFRGDPRDLTAQQHQQLPNSADIVTNQGGGREARDQVGADLRAQGHQATPNYPTGISVPETGNSALGQGQPEQPADGRQITRNSQGVLEVRGPTGGPVDAQGRPYGPSNTPRTNKTGEEYSQTSTFQIDDDGNAVYDDDGNLIETDYGRDVKKRQDHGRNMAARRRDRRAERDERLGDSYLESSPEARRQKREQRIGVKRNRAVEMEFGTGSDVDEAINDDGLSSFITDRRLETEQEEANIADTAGRGQRESDERIEERHDRTNIETTVLGNEGRADEQELRNKGLLDVTTQTTTAAAEAAQLKREDDAAESDLRRSQAMSDRQRDEDDRQKRRGEEVTDAARERQTAINNLDEDTDVARRMAIANQGMSPEALEEDRLNAEADKDFSTMGPEQKGGLISQGVFNADPASPEGKRYSETRYFVQHAGLDEDSSGREVFQASARKARQAKTPEAKQELARNLINTITMFDSLRSGELSEGLTGLGWAADMALNEGAMATENPTDWFNDGMSLGSDSSPEALENWIDNIPKASLSSLNMGFGKS